MQTTTTTTTTIKATRTKKTKQKTPKISNKLLGSCSCQNWLRDLCRVVENIESDVPNLKIFTTMQK